LKTPQYDDFCHIIDSKALNYDSIDIGQENTIRLKRLTLPTRFIWVKVLQDINASPAVTCLQDHIRIYAYFVANAFGREISSAPSTMQKSIKRNPF